MRVMRSGARTIHVCPRFLVLKTPSTTPWVKQTVRTNTATTAASPKYLRIIHVTQESVKNPGQKIDFQLSVVDTHPGQWDRPTVFGVHGSPGAGTDFEPLISQLAERGIRFVGPTSPGFEPSFVEPWKLLHIDYTTEGRAKLARSVMEELKLDRINVLLCHSAGSWAGYKMAAEWPEIESAVFLNPAGARPHKSLRPFPVVKCVAWVLRQRSLHFLLMPLMARVYAQIGFSGIKGGEHLMVAQEIVTSQGFENMPGFAAKIRERKLPLVFAYTLNDKIIESPVAEEMMLNHLGIPSQNVLKYSKNENPDTDHLGLQESWCSQGLQFERGGHVVHKAYPKVILQRILSLLSLQKHVAGL